MSRPIRALAALSWFTAVMLIRTDIGAAIALLLFTALLMLASGIVHLLRASTEEPADRPRAV